MEIMIAVISRPGFDFLFSGSMILEFVARLCTGLAQSDSNRAGDNPSRGGVVTAPVTRNAITTW